MKRRLFSLFIAFTFVCAAASASLAADKNDYYSGLDLYHAGDYEGAAKAFRSQLNKTPSDEAVKKWLGLAEKRVSELKDVAPAAAQAPRPAPAAAEPYQEEPTPAASGNAQDGYERGIALYLSGDYKASLASFNGYLQLHPDHVATQQWITLVKALVPGASGAKNPEKRLPAVVSENKPVPPAPKPATKPAPVVKAAPKPASAPAPASSAAGTGREKELAAEVERLRDELKTSEETAQRAIEQTKKALAIPSPSFQSYEQDNIRKSMMTEIEELRAREEYLAGQLQAANEANARLKQQGGQARPAQAPAADDRRAAAAEKEIKEAREALQRMSQEFQAAQEELTQLQASQGRLLSDMRKKDVELNDARNELKERSVQEQQYADSVQKAQLADNARVDAERRAVQLQKELEIAKGKSAETQRALAQMAAQVQSAQDANADTERKLAELTQRTRGASGELENLRASRDKVAAQLESKEQQLIALEQKLAKTESLLEESRAQGLRLVIDAQKERSQRQETESREAEVRAELDAVKAQLQAMRTALKGLNI